MTDPLIRTASVDEAGAVLELWKRSVVGASIPDDLESVNRLLEHSPESLIVASVDGQVVGTLITAWDGWRGNMYRLAVDESHRRRGIARALVDEGERRLRAVGCRRVTALVLHAHDWAVEFWNAASYEHDQSTARFVRNLD